MRFLLIAVYCIIPFLLLGCGSSDVASVVGTVEVNGQPLANGTISFGPAEGDGDAASATITNGAYEVRIAPGPKVIQITGPRVTGQRKAYEGPGAPMIDIIEESIPEQYNVRTTLKMDVQPGKNTKTWTLQTNKK